MAINGCKVLVFIGTDEVGSQKDATINRKTNLIDASAKQDEEEVLLAGRNSTTITANAMYIKSDTAYQALKTAQAAKTTVTAKVKESGTEVESMTCYVESINVNHPDQAGSTYSVTLRKTA